MTRGPKPHNGARLLLNLGEGQEGLTSEQLRLCVAFVLATGTEAPWVARGPGAKPKLLALPPWMHSELTGRGRNGSATVRGAVELRKRHAVLMADRGFVGHEALLLSATSGPGAAVRYLVGRGSSDGAAWLFVGNLGRFRDGSV